MNEVELKVEFADPDELSKFREFLFSQDPEIVPFEIYSHAPGFNKEPIVISIIIALGGEAIFKSLKKIIKEYMANKLLTKQENNRHQEEMLRLSIKNENNDFKSITKEEFDDLKIT